MKSVYFLFWGHHLNEALQTTVSLYVGSSVATGRTSTAKKVSANGLIKCVPNVSIPSNPFHLISTWGLCSCGESTPPPGQTTNSLVL